MMTTSSTFRRSSSNSDRSLDARFGSVHVRVSSRRDGDFHLASSGLRTRQRDLVDLPWTMLDQVHGSEVVRVEAPGDGHGLIGDIAVTALTDTVLGCWVADCAPIVLVGSEELAIVHAGWRGLAAGVVQAAAAALSDAPNQVVLGPTIGPCCYEFGAAELASVAAGVETSVDTIAARTRDGRRSLDLPAAVTAAVTATWGPLPVEQIGGCPGCSFPGYSHRVRGDRERHVVAAWRVDD